MAEQFIAAVEESKTKNPPLTFFISFIADDVRKQAKESTNSRAAAKVDRDLEMHDTFNAGSPPIIFAGKSLSILDGILLAVKDDVDCLPHPSTGTFSLLQILDVRPKIQFQVLIVSRCVRHVSQFLLVCLCQLEQNGWPKCEK